MSALTVINDVLASERCQEEVKDPTLMKYGSRREMWSVPGARSQNVISTKMITNPWSWRIWDEARATMAEFSRALFEPAKVESYGDVIIKRPYRRHEKGPKGGRMPRAIGRL